MAGRQACDIRKAIGAIAAETCCKVACAENFAMYSIALVNY